MSGERETSMKPKDDSADPYTDACEKAANESGSAACIMILFDDTGLTACAAWGHTGMWGAYARKTASFLAVSGMQDQDDAHRRQMASGFNCPDVPLEVISRILGHLKVR